MLTIAEALDLVREHARPLPSGKVKLADALGRVLAEDAVSNIDSPPHDKSLMDGFAVRTIDLTEGTADLSVIEELTAGEVPTRDVGPQQATRIMTGAPIPSGADAVVMVERTSQLPDRQGAPQVRIDDPTVRPQQNIMRLGVSIRRGDVVLPAGRTLRPVDIGLLAEAVGGAVSVSPQSTVAVLATGNELTDAEQPAAGQIRNSNGPMLLACSQQAGAATVDLGVARDELSDLTDRIRQGLKADVLVMSGGVSAGVLDLAPQALASCGVRQVFHKVRLKPGKPLWFGVADHNDHRTLVFGLPGNPVSGLVCFMLFVAPTLAALSGRSFKATQASAALATEFTQRSDRPVYWPATLDPRQSVATPLAWKGSADLRTLAEADCLIHFPAGERVWSAGESVEVTKL